MPLICRGQAVWIGRSARTPPHDSINSRTDRGSETRFDGKMNKIPLAEDKNRRYFISLLYSSFFSPVLLL